MSCMQSRFRSMVVLSNLLLCLGACSSDGSQASNPSASPLEGCRQTLGTSLNGDGECEDERRCAFVRATPSETYSYLVKMRSVDGFSTGPVAEDVFDCAATVMEAAGASVTRGDDRSLLQVKGTYSQVKEALSWAVTRSWLPVCASEAECSRCTTHTIAACVEDPFCSTIYGGRIVDGVKGASTPIGCAVRACDPGVTYALDQEGACWEVGCVLEGWTLATRDLCRVK